MVKVTIGRQSNGISLGVDDHPAGQDFLVRDGHLTVLDSKDSTAKHVAVYAPGQWASAVIEDEGGAPCR